MAKRVICCDVGDDEGKTWLSDVVYKTGKISMDKRVGNKGGGGGG